jgi:hypothetical protein
MPLLRGRDPYNQVLNMASFWLMSGGVVFMTFVLTFAGTIQTHLQRVNGEAYMDVQDQLWIFYAMRFGSGVAVVLGALLFIYAMLPAARGGRPRPAASDRLSSHDPTIWRSDADGRNPNHPRRGRRRPLLPAPGRRVRSSRPPPPTACRCC